MKPLGSKAPGLPAKAPRAPGSYTPISDAPKERFCFADSELAEGIRRHGLVSLLAQAISRQRRRGARPIENLLGALRVWPLLTLKSIHCFCCELGQILRGEASVLYDFLGREDVSWRVLSSQLARQVFQANDLGPRPQRAFVVDDTTQERAGRKIEGASSHFDHTQGRTIHGHQILQLGLAGAKGFIPLAGQIVMSDMNPVAKRLLRPASAKARFKTASLVVDLDLETRPNQPPRWTPVWLVFSAPVRQARRDARVVFVCTDTALSDAAKM